MMVWRTKSEKLTSDCIQQINTGDREKVDLTKYCEVLRNQLIPSVKRLLQGTKYIFQHDLVRWHTSNIVKEQITKLKINILEWASKSPDLNVVEELWSIIDKRLASKPINAKAELQKRLQEESDNISTTSCRTLVDSVLERIEKCLKAKGSHFL
ncbi:unnamed protein product [Rotaria sp. Silwood2]|nr:unnamed protein product [Rotaria sp. Silwood2]